MSRERLRKAVQDDKGKHVIIKHGDFRFEVREPTVGDKAIYADTMSGLNNGEKIPAAEVTRGVMRLVSKCVYDPDDGVRLYSDDEAEELMGGRELVRKFVDTVTGFLKEEGNAAVKKSEETATSASVSSLENSSAAH